MYRKATAIHLSFLLLILIVPTLTFAGPKAASPSDTTEVQSIVDAITQSQTSGVKIADLNALSWEMFDASKYSKEQILSDTVKGITHPFNLSHDTVDVENLPSAVWLQTTFSIPDSLKNKQFYFSFQVFGAAELYWNGELFESYGNLNNTSEVAQYASANVEYTTLEFSGDSLQQLSFRINTENIKVSQGALISHPELGVRFPEIFFSWESVNE